MLDRLKLGIPVQTPIHDGCGSNSKSGEILSVESHNDDDVLRPDFVTVQKTGT